MPRYFRGPSRSLQRFFRQAAQNAFGGPREVGGAGRLQAASGGGRGRVSQWNSSQATSVGLPPALYAVSIWAGESLRRNFNAGRGALLAETVDFELVARGPKSVACRYQRLDSVHFGTLELDDAATVEADEMLMDRLRREAVFIPFEALSEVELATSLLFTSRSRAR